MFWTIILTNRICIYIYIYIYDVRYRSLRPKRPETCQSGEDRELEPAEAQLKVSLLGGSRA